MNPASLTSLVLLLICLAAAPLRADDAAIKKLVKENVQTLNEALITEEYAKVADYTHPKVVELMGGREKMIGMIATGLRQMKSQGVEVKSVKVGEPCNPVKQGAELYLYVPFELTMKVPTGKMTIPSYVIGVSSDQGKTWTFVDANGGESIKKVLPDLPAALKLPEKKAPVIEKD